MLYNLNKGAYKMKEVILTAKDGKKIFCSLWDKATQPIGVVQIIHGMDEHVKRYDRFANFLNKHGYVVFGDDHRAHGRTAANISKIGKPDGDKDLFKSIVSDEIMIAKHLKTTYKLPVLTFGHSYGSFITQKLMEKPNFFTSGVCLSGSARYPLPFVALGLGVSFIGDKLFGPDAPARLIEEFSPIRGKNHGASKLTRDKKQVILHEKDPMRAKYFSYGFYYSMFKNLMHFSNKINKNLPILIISGDRDPVSMNGILAKKLYNIYKQEKATNLSMILYPEDRHELLMEINYKQVQKDILNFFNSVIHTVQQKKKV